MNTRTNRYVIPVTFFVGAENAEEAQEKLRTLIEHGQSAHNGDVEWVWGISTS